MNYKIYQAYFKEEQKKFLNPEFTPFDNTKNKRPDLLEYYIFKLKYKQVMQEKLTHWGIFSWRWKEKCKIEPSQFINFVNQNPNNDVYVMNWAPYLEAVSMNVWSQGNCTHSSISNIASAILKEMNCQIDLENTIMTRKIYCFSSYFLASQTFWTDYLNFLDSFKKTIDSSIKLKIMVNQSAGYYKNKNLNYFPFLVERLFSFFLLLNESKYSIINYPYDFKIYEEQIGSHYKIIENLSNIKIQIKQNLLTSNDWNKELMKLPFKMRIPTWIL